MTNYAKVDTINRKIIMDRTFAKNAAIIGSAQYNLLQACRADYPDYEVVQRRIQKNSNQEHYRGLSYGYMEEYILNHEDGEDVVEVLQKFNEMKLIAACHSRGRRYPVIKQWFLERYPEVASFGVQKVETDNMLSVIEGAQAKEATVPEDEKKDA